MGISYQKKRQTPKRKAVGSTPAGDTSAKNTRPFFSAGCFVCFSVEQQVPKVEVAREGDPEQTGQLQ